MGFYAPAQIVRDAREHGVEVRPVDVNHSDHDCTLEPGRNGFALRLGLRQVDGMNEEHSESIVTARDRPYADIRGLRDQAGVPVATLERLASADAFRSMGLDRRQALWEVRALKAEKSMPLFKHASARKEGEDADVTLPQMSLPEHVVVDYQTVRLSLKAHPVSFFRDSFEGKGIVPALTLWERKDGERIAVAGVALVRQMPGTAKGVVFITLEDETGIVNCIVWPKTFERYRRTVMGSRVVFIRGRIQRTEEIIHVITEHLEDWSHLLLGLSDGGNSEYRQALSHADEVARPGQDHRESHHRHPRNVRIIPKSRDFH